MSISSSRRPTSTDHDPAAGRVVGPLVGALLFVAAYLAVSPVATPLQGRAMPLPGAPVEEVYGYLVSSGGALLATAALQLLSVGGLLLFLTRPAVRAAAGRTLRATAAMVAGHVAVAAMLVTVVLTTVLGLSAGSMAPETAGLLRTAAFIAGGVVHVVALGLLAGLLSRSDGWSRPVRVFGLVAAIPAVLSVLSTVFFYASVLLPVGRLLVMAWLVTAAVSLLRHRSRSSVL